MHRRAFLSLANVAVAAVALLLWLRYPQYAYYGLYLLFGWFIASFTLSWTVRGAPTASAPAAARPPAATGGKESARPLGSGPIATSPPAIPFCIYCGTDLHEGVDRCAACGHAVASLGGA